MTDMPTWERRFRAPILAFPSWAADAPDRLVMASTESGSYQLHTWDRATGERRQVTEDPVGVLEGRPTRDGTGVIWFHDETGAESGSYVIAAFDERTGAEPLIEGLPVGWPEGLAIGRTRSIAGVSTDEGFSVWTAEHGGVARLIHEHPEPVRLAGGWGLTSAVDRRALSSDETLAVLEVMEDGDVLHPTLRSIDAVTGATVAELRDEGLELSGFAFSPLPGDTRMAITHERTGERRPAIWDARTGEVTDLPLELPRADRARGLVGRRLGPAPAPARRRPAPPPPLRPRDRRGHPARDRAGIDHRRRPSGPTARSGTASTTASTRRRCSRWARRRRSSPPRDPRRPRAGRSSPGGSRTPTASGSTGSSCGRRATGPTR